MRLFSWFGRPGVINIAVATNLAAQTECAVMGQDTLATL